MAKTTYNGGEAARAIGVDVRTINRWILTGKMQGVKSPAGHWIIDIDEVESYKRVKDSRKELLRFMKKLARTGKYSAVETVELGEAFILARSNG